MPQFLLFLGLSLPFLVHAQCDPSTVFANDSTNAVCMITDATVRTIYTNNLPNHSFGNWPSNNPVSPQALTFMMCAFPQQASAPTSIYDAGDLTGCSPYVEFGVASNGIRIAPFGARWFVNPNTMEENRAWNVEALVLFRMDFNNSHANGRGEYHYHGIPASYFTDSLAIDGSTHSPIVGYAADGFPIYYKYVYTDPSDTGSSINAFSSGYTLRPGDRPGDGVTAPDGPYDGLYVEDYEYLDSNWPLDECNGRFGITPEYPAGTYYYVMTDNWPYIPRCFSGTVIDNSFRIGPNCPPSNSADDCREEIVQTVDYYPELSLGVGPNPTASVLRLYANNPDTYALIDQLTIFDLAGRRWYQQAAYQGPLDVSGLPAGTYFLQIDLGNTQITKKVLIIK